MDNKTIDQIDDMFQEHIRTVIRKITYGKPAQTLEESLNTHLNEMIKNLERNLGSAELLTTSTYEFLHSEAPGLIQEFKHLAETHSDNAISAFQSASTSAHNATLEVLSAEQANKEEQSEEISSINKRKRATIEGEKEDDQRRNSFELREIIKNAISDRIISIQQVAVRNTFSSDISDRLTHLKGLSRNVLQNTIETLVTDFDTHTEEIHTIIQTEMDKYELEVLKAAGLDEIDRQTDKTAQNQEPVFTQELLDSFKNNTVDMSKLSPQECAWYLNYLFDGPLPEIVQTNNRAAFKDSPGNEALVDSLPASILDNPFEETTSNNAAKFKDGTETTILDVSPELQPLPADVLAEYNKNVAAGRKSIEDKQETNPDKNEKNVDSLPDLFL